MCCNTILSVLVHLGRSDLDLEGVAVIVIYSSMQRAVEVILWSGNIVIEFTRDWAPVGVDNAQGGITRRDIRHKDPDASDIVYHLEWDTLPSHLPVDRIDMFGSCEYFRIDICLL